MNEVALFKGSVDNFLVLNSDVNVAEILEDNFDGEVFSPSEMTRISIPAGGATIFEIETAEGLTETKEIDAIILKAQPLRMWFSKDYGESDERMPDCISYDLITGEGDPGGKCAECPLNVWGSDPKGGEGKACSERRDIYILTPQALLPYRLSCPTKSIKNYKMYIQTLSRSGLVLSSVITRITLTKEKNNKGVAYSELQFALKEKLTPEMAKTMKGYKRAFVATLQNNSPFEKE